MQCNQVYLLQVTHQYRLLRNVLGLKDLVLAGLSWFVLCWGEAGFERFGGCFVDESKGLDEDLVVI